MLLFFKILLLFWAINITPVLLNWMLKKRLRLPVDAGCMFPDGRPLLGKHKTIRGSIGAILTATILGMILGFPLHVALPVGFLSMAGDLFSSFIKRRLRFAEGVSVPILDQVPEGIFPLLVLVPHLQLSATFVVFLLIVFTGTAFCGSLFVNGVLLKKPFEGYSRSLMPRSRFREWRSCQTIGALYHSLINIEQRLLYSLFLKNVFKAVGLYGKGMRNALDIRCRKITITFDDLPPAFEGYTLLFLSDLHLDCLEGITEKVKLMVEKLPVDLCIFGGDYRAGDHGCFEEAIDKLKDVAGSIKSRQGIYAIMGNHDCLEMIEPLKESGISFLVNRSVSIEKGGELLWLCGVDDSYYYEGHDLEVAFNGIPDGAFVVFLAHEPGLYADAASRHAQLYLCGHTHGGQVLVPGLGAVVTHCRAPRAMVYGRWAFGKMQGYTSSGVGTSGIPVRFGCRGEVVQVTLKGGHSSSL